MASARQLVQGFLSAFGQQLGADLALDASGTCIIRVYDSIDLVFEVLEEQEDGDRICLRSPLASIAGHTGLETLFRDLLLYNFVVYTRTGVVLVHAGDEPRIDAVMNFAPDHLSEQTFFSLVVGFLRMVEEAQAFLAARLDTPTSNRADAPQGSMILRG